MTELFIPPCRDGQTEAERVKEADRAVLYGACLLVLRPAARIKLALKEAVEQLRPAVEAYCAGSDGALAEQAQAYAEACGAGAFLESKAAEYRRRSGR